MAVWLPKTVDLAQVPLPPTLASSSRASSSYCWPPDSVAAVNDQAEPADSNDHSIPRLTWWDHKGTAEWLQYDFDRPTKVAAVEVYWFDDTRPRRLPGARVLAAAVPGRRAMEARRDAGQLGRREGPVQCRPFRSGDHRRPEDRTATAAQVLRRRAGMEGAVTQFTQPPRNTNKFYVPVEWWC